MATTKVMDGIISADGKTVHYYPMATNRWLWYVGYKAHGLGREAFAIGQGIEPTERNMGWRYLATWGPFRTKRGAMFGASPMAVNNPHVQTVADAERIAKGACSP